MIQRIQKISRPVLISLALLFGFSTAALAGSLTPPGIVASTMHSLQELYDSIAGTFDSSAIVANENGSLMENLKFIEDNMGTGSGGSVSSDSLDFDEFVDNMNLDANTSIASHGFALTTTANVGIGTTSPTEKLQVMGTIVASGSAGYVRVAPSGNITAQSLNSAATSSVAAVNDVGRSILMSIGGSTAAFRPNESYVYSYPNGTHLHIQAEGGDIMFHANPAGFGYAGTSLKMHLTGAGNLGIGEACNVCVLTPDQKLDVTGNILASTSGNVDLILRSTTSDDTRFTFRSVGASDRLDILGSVSQPYLTILKGGNVGIGTINPTTKLSVAGTASISGTLYANGGCVGCGGTPGALVLIESHNFATPATTFTFSGLNGNTDGTYLLKYRLVKNVVPAVQVTVRPNGLTTNLITYSRYFGTIPTGQFSSPDLPLDSNGGSSTGDISSGEMWIYAETGQYRVFSGIQNQFRSDGTFLKLDTFGRWADNATNITSIDLVADQTDGIGAGSYFRLYKLNP